MPDNPADLQSIKRRQFLQALAVAGGATTLASDGAAQEAGIPTHPTSFDFTHHSAALKSDRVVMSACQFCNANCRLHVHLKHGRVIDIVGETKDPVQAGGLCVKAPMLSQLVYNLRRLTTPLKRVAGVKGDPESNFEPISWDEAYTIIATKFLQLRDEGQSHTIANRTTGRMPRGCGSLVGRFFQLLGSPNDTDVGPVCNDAGGNALAWTLGLGNFTNGYGIDGSTGEEDLGKARFILMLGTNQAETHPVTFAHVLRERDKIAAKLVVVDPRKTPTAGFADRWLAPKPHTDLALVLGMLHHIMSEDLVDHDAIDKWVVGFDELKRHVIDHEYTADWSARVCDVKADDIREIATDYASAKPAAIYCNAGISHQISAFDTYRVITFLAAITGNIGVPGGGCNFMHNTWPGGLNLPSLTAPTPPRREALPVGPDYFAESILTGKPYRLRAVVTAGNPLLGSANTNKVKRAMASLEFYVYAGLFREEAADYADVILPVCSGLEMETVYMRRDDRGIRWQEQAVERVGQSQPDWQIWIELAHKMESLDTRTAAGYWADAFPLDWNDYRELWKTFVAETPGMRGMTRERMMARAEPLRWPCPSETHPGTSTLYLDHPSWYEAAESLDRANRGKRFLTPSGKIEIYTPAIEAKLAVAGHTALPIFYTHPQVTGSHPSIRYEPMLVRNPVNPQALTPRVVLGELNSPSIPEAIASASSGFDLMGIIGRPSVVHFAGVTQWTHMGKEKNGERFIQIHPATAQSRGIKNGDLVTVSSPRGSLLGTALHWEGIRRDCVFVPNTFGPSQVVGDEFGFRRYEAANVLVDDRYFDNLSGQQAYKCFGCRVARVD